MKPRTAFSRVVTVDGQNYRWTLYYWPERLRGEHPGVTVWIQHTETPGQPLLVEFPARQSRFLAALPASIREALAAGWQPQGQGKPFLLHGKAHDSSAT